jgi:hypothetical protein
MEAFTRLAQLRVDGKAGERWIVDKVAEILSRSGYTPIPNRRARRPEPGALGKKIVQPELLQII